MKKWYVAILLFSLIFTLSDCKQGPNKQTEKQSDIGEEVIVDASELIVSKCISCHSMTEDSNPLNTSDFYTIKQMYLKDAPSKTEFVNVMTRFLIEPSSENALMQNAIDAYGLMPMLNLPQEEYKSIARYIYDYDFKRQEEKHQMHTDKSNEGQDSLLNAYLVKGKDIALATKKELGKNLKGAIQREGTEGAVKFCNLVAIPLTDSIAHYHQVNVKRVSDRPRNPMNRVNESELDYIMAVKRDLEKNIRVDPMLLETPDHFIGYYPIMTNGMCLQCHGLPKEEIKLKTLDRINNLYPNDLATGYMTNQLRGIWVVEHKK